MKFIFTKKHINQILSLISLLFTAVILCISTQYYVLAQNITLSELTETWESVGDPTFRLGDYMYFTFANSKNDTPYITFRDADNGEKLTVQKFNGSSWEIVGTPGFSAGKVAQIAIAFDSLDFPVVAYQDNGNSGKAAVQRFNGNSWELVGTAGFSNGGIAHTSLVIDSEDSIYIAYSDLSLAKEILIKKFDGNSWNEVSPDGLQDYPWGEIISLEINWKNDLYIAYQDSYYGSTATVQRFAGTQWEVVGEAGFSDDSNPNMDFVLSEVGVPYFAEDTDEGIISLKYFDANKNSWKTPGNGSFHSYHTSELSLALDKYDVPYIAYVDMSTNHTILVRRFDGSNWEVVGENGLSEDAVHEVSMTTDKNGTPYVVYHAGDNNGKDIIIDKITYSVPQFGEVPVNNPSSTNTFTMRGSELNGNVNVAAPQGFEVSRYSDTGFTDTLTISPTAGSVNTTIYVRFHPDTVGQYSGNILISSPGATSQKISVNGISIALPTLYTIGASSIKATSVHLNGSVDDDGNSTILERGFVYNSTGFPTISDDKVIVEGSTGAYETTLSNLQSATSYFVRSYAINAAGVGYSPDISNFITATVDISIPEFEKGWKTVGIPGISMGQAAYVTMDIDKNGTPYVAYTDYGNGGRASVKRYVDGAWETVGSEGISAGSAGHTSLALDGNGVPYIAYRGGAAGYQIVVKKFNGTTWEAVGVVDPSAKNASTVKIAINQNNQPYVVYNDGGYSNEATVRRFNGSSWEIVGTKGFSAGDVDYVDIAFNDVGIPYVAYRDQGNAYKATVQFFNGSQWEVAGSPGFSAEKVEFVDIAISAQNNIYVAYRDIGNGARASVQQYVDGNWQYVGTPGFSEGVVDYTSLVFDRKGYPYVAYKDAAQTRKATVQKFNGSHWESVGGPGFTPDDVDYTFIDRDANDNLYLAYRDRSTGGKVSAQKLANRTLNFDSTDVETISKAQKFTVIGNNIIDSITLVAPTGFEISTDSISSYGDTLIIHPTTNPMQQIVFARFSPDSLKTYEGKITITTSHANPQMIAVSGTAVLSLPEVTTVAINSPTASSAIVQGEVVINAWDSISEKGFVYAQHPNPDLSDKKITSEDEGESFSRIIENLQPGTTYYARAFAANAAGTGFGEVVQFTTLKAQPTIHWTISSPIVYGDTLNNDGLSATASWEGNTLSGTFTYFLDSTLQQPAEGAFLYVGNDQSIFVQFMPEVSTAYLPVVAQTTIDVVKRTITVTVQDTSKVYGEENPEFTISYEGFVNGEDESVFAKIPTMATEADKTSSAGTYPITVSGGSDSQYSFEYVSGTLTIHKATQTITFADLPDITTATTEVKLSASASSNLPVLYHVEGPATLEDTVLKITGEGTITVTASQPGNENYQAAEDVIQSFTVVEEDQPETPKTPQTITFADLPDITTATTEIKLSASASSNLPVLYHVEGPATLEDTVLKITNEGTVTVTASQVGNENYQAAEDVTQSFTVVEEDQPETPKIPQTIIIEAPETITLEEPLELKGASSSGLPVSYVIEGPAIIEGNMLIPTDTGTITLTIIQSGNESYEPAQNLVIKIRIEELTVTGIEDDRLSNTINVFPNPTAGKFSIAFDDHSWQGGSIIITDLLGNIIMTKSVTGDIEIFDIREKNTGIYFLMIQKGDRQKTFKLLKI